MKKILAIMSILIAFSSCNTDDDDVYYKIPKNIKPICSAGDVFSFYSSQNGKTEEWTVDRVVKEKYQLVDYRLNCEETDHYMGDRYTTYYSIDDSGSIIISQNQGGIENIEFYKPHYPRIYYYPVSASYIVIDDEGYYVDVMKPEKSYQYYPTEIFCSHQCGVLRFSYGDTVTYNILNPLTEKKYKK